MLKNNIFNQLGLTGSVLRFEGAWDQSNQLLLIKQNRFEYIHTYAGTGLLDIRRNMNPDLSPYIVDNMFDYTKYSLAFMNFGGGYMIEENYFRETIGCAPHSNTAAI